MFWYQFDNFHNIPMELHLPCRDPLEHLMSQCNHKKIQFDCDSSNDGVVQSVKKCLVGMNRFKKNLGKMDNINLKCYDFEQQFTSYMDYIASRLQRRRFVSEYKPRETNRLRDREHECLWKDAKLKDFVENYLVKNVQYYKYCKLCLGSVNDITSKLSRNQSK